MTRKKTSPVEILAIVDRSGSMSNIRQETITSYNAFLADQKSVPGEAYFTLALFDDQYELPVDHVALADVPELTSETFVPRGYTALHDAIGRSLTALEARNPDKAVIIIITDGAENASKEFTSQQVKEMITKAEARGWQVQFLAANIDAFSTGGALGISGATTMNFSADAKGVQEAYATASINTRSYRA